LAKDSVPPAPLNTRLGLRFEDLMLQMRREAVLALLSYRYAAL
jgi:hypothetical protein